MPGNSSLAQPLLPTSNASINGRYSIYQGRSHTTYVRTWYCFHCGVGLPILPAAGTNLQQQSHSRNEGGCVGREDGPSITAQQYLILYVHSCAALYYRPPPPLERSATLGKIKIVSYLGAGTSSSVFVGGRFTPSTSRCHCNCCCCSCVYMYGRHTADKRAFAYVLYAGDGATSRHPDCTTSTAAVVVTTKQKTDQNDTSSAAFSGKPSEKGGVTIFRQNNRSSDVISEHTSRHSSPPQHTDAW